MKKTIILNDLLACYNYVDSGSIVFNEAKDMVLKNEIVVLDMSNVESVPTTFLNTSLGALMDIYGVERVKKSFRFRNVLRTQVDRLTKYFNDYQVLLGSN